MTKYGTLFDIFDCVFLRYTKGTGTYNKYRRGVFDGDLRIENVTYAETGIYECVVETAVGNVYATSQVGKLCTSFK